MSLFATITRWSKRSKLFLAAALAVAVMCGCGADLFGPGVWDDTCFDCRTVCEGTEDEILDTCLANCSECQGYSDCFGWLEDRYDGMLNGMSDWIDVDCDDV